MSTTLQEFNDVEPLIVREKTNVMGEGTVYGWAGPSNRDGNVLVSHRHRFEYDDGNQDYFCKCGGYTFDLNALREMKRIGVDIIAVYEVDNGRVLEFELAQFLNSNLNSDTIVGLEPRSENGATNQCVPIENAIHTWKLSECRIIDDH